MYCLECGQKIGNGQTACQNCGASVDEMKQRIAEAQEKVTYAETVGPAKTTKLPPVPERIYRDKDGNIIDPAEAIDASIADKKKDASLPVIGHAEDPYMTMPIQKIVSDDGRVITGANDEVRTFIQPPNKKKRLSARAKAILTLLIIFAAIAIAAVVLDSAGVFKQSEIVQQDEVAQVEDQVSESAPSEAQSHQARIDKVLESNYTTLGNYRGQVNTVVSNFNNFHVASDKTKRQQHADECDALIASISDSKAALIEDMNEIGLMETDSSFSTYEQINKLYDLLLTRLNVIKECWDVSLSFDKPKEHAEEILAPLSKDIKGGKSTSIAQFDELYSQVSILGG